MAKNSRTKAFLGTALVGAVSGLTLMQGAPPAEARELRRGWCEDYQLNIHLPDDKCHAPQHTPSVAPSQQGGGYIS